MSNTNLCFISNNKHLHGGNEVETCVKDYIDESQQWCERNGVLHRWMWGPEQFFNFLFTMYLQTVLKTPVRKIIHYFLESGHSHNEGDSVHAMIDKAIRKLAVFVPEQYYGTVQEAKKKGNKYVVK